MSEMTTIQLERAVVEELKEAKEHPRQTYNELVERMIQVFQAAKKNNQYDSFLHTIQQAKMKELWNTKEDEAWDHV